MDAFDTLPPRMPLTVLGIALRNGMAVGVCCEGCVAGSWSESEELKAKFWYVCERV